MDEVERRYQAATEYVRRAVATVAANKAPDGLEMVVARYKIDPIVGELRGIEAKWLRSTTATERELLARDAERLADRTKENLPGAPTDWRRTNLFPGEVETQMRPTSLDAEINTQAGDAWTWVKGKASAAADTLATAGKWLALGGATLLGLHLVGAFEQATPRTPRRNAAPTTLCPFCRRAMSVDSDGLIALHTDPDGDVCKGSAGRPLGRERSRPKKRSTRRGRR